MKPRYRIDSRRGCLAVVDKLFANETHDFLTPTSPGVVAYWEGVQRGGDWSVPFEAVEAAMKLCDKLNYEKG